jgi:hypothetical protein
MFEIGQRVQLTAKGKKICTSGPVEEKRNKYIFKGTIEDIIHKNIYVVKMDDEGFHCRSHGLGCNTFLKESLKKLKED